MSAGRARPAAGLALIAVLLLAGAAGQPAGNAAGPAAGSGAAQAAKSGAGRSAGDATGSGAGLPTGSDRGGVSGSGVLSWVRAAGEALHVKLVRWPPSG